MDILSKVLNYESSIFEEYSSKRKDLIKSIKNMEILDKDQLVIFISDLKAIIDPIKTSISAIDHYFSNKDFTDKKSLNDFEELNKLMMYYFLLRRTSFSELDETLEIEISDSVSDSVSESEPDSDSVSKSSRSVSVTFSSTSCVE